MFQLFRRVSFRPETKTSFCTDRSQKMQPAETAGQSSALNVCSVNVFFQGDTSKSVRIWVI